MGLVAKLFSLNGKFGSGEEVQSCFAFMACFTKKQTRGNIEALSKVESSKDLCFAPYSYLQEISEFSIFTMKS